MGLTLILSLLAGIVPIFQKQLGTEGEALATTGVTSIGDLIAAFKNGSPASEAQATLTTLQGVLTDLEKSPSTDPADLPQIVEVTKLVEAAITGFETAEAGIDPTKLNTPPAV